jgi:hypothetical protein
LTHEGLPDHQRADNNALERAERRRVREVSTAHESGFGEDDGENVGRVRKTVH